MKNIVAVLLAIMLAGCVPLTAEPTARISITPTYIRPEFNLPVTIEPTSDASTVVLDPERPYYLTSLTVQASLGLPEELGGIFWVPNAAPLAATFKFENATDNDRHLTFLCMLNYVQIPCADGRRSVATTVRPGERVFTPLIVSGLQPGRNRYSVVALSYLPLTPELAHDTMKLEELVIRSTSTFYWNGEVDIIVGSDDEQDVTYMPVQTRQSRENVAESLTFNTVRTTGAPEDRYKHPNFGGGNPAPVRPLTVKPGEVIRFDQVGAYSAEAPYMAASKRFSLSNDTSTLPFVLTAFLDDRQIPLHVGSPDVALFGTIPPDREAIVPLSFTAPQEPGIYSFFTLYREGPQMQRGTFIPQSDGGVVYRYYGSLGELVTSNRVVIEVAP